MQMGAKLAVLICVIIFSYPIIHQGFPLLIQPVHALTENEEITLPGLKLPETTSDGLYGANEDADYWEERGDQLFMYALDEGIISEDIRDLTKAREGEENIAGGMRVIEQGYAIREALMSYAQAVYKNPLKGPDIALKLIKRLDQIVSYMSSSDLDPILNTTWSDLKEEPRNETTG